MGIYVCDFIDPSTNDFDSFVVDAVDEDEAKNKAIEQLKTFSIPKRYLIRIEEVI